MTKIIFFDTFKIIKVLLKSLLIGRQGGEMRNAIVSFIALFILWGVGWLENYFGLIDVNQLVSQKHFYCAFSAYFVCGGLTVILAVTMLFAFICFLGFFCALLDGTIDDHCW
ncbi:MAG: hypothetical protein PHE59_02000 [Patescibacteria group bacterium]|nr:hypothetical protein [Patescibacteria group bacterium]MDD5164722.1 hypothetical protein [Patescibacteria group bacterium]MDD5534555.1 hypothetical protein [Patescibacteria group bacterium]